MHSKIYYPNKLILSKLVNVPIKVPYKFLFHLYAFFIHLHVLKMSSPFKFMSQTIPFHLKEIVLNFAHMNKKTNKQTKNKKEKTKTNKNKNKKIFKKSLQR